MTLEFISFLSKILTNLPNDYALSINSSWDETTKALASIWNFQIMTIDNNPLTINKLFSSFVIFVLGIFISRIITKNVSKRIYSKFHLDLSGRHAIENLTFYLFVVFFVFFALKVSNIPLTVFNLLGGALAIGVGFGSQNIVNNFISGIILMLERPIKIGDFININDSFGKIENIGLRSTRILSTGNKHIIVPNSKLLEDQLANWTLNDTIIRTTVKVGVNYGSPVEKVTEILKECARKNSQIIPNKEILVIFDNFGDNSLDFEVYYFIKVTGHLDEKKTQGELRNLIEKRFREEEIVVAFPQRDLHLYTSKPIDIKLIDRKNI